jgi:hypothetical protein
MIELKLPEEGDRIRLISMTDDPCPIPPGTTGVVGAFINKTPFGDHQISVKWDNGRTLMLCVPPDTFEIID